MPQLCIQWFNSLFCINIYCMCNNYCIICNQTWISQLALLRNSMYEQALHIILLKGTSCEEANECIFLIPIVQKSEVYLSAATASEWKWKNPLTKGSRVLMAITQYQLENKYKGIQIFRKKSVVLIFSLVSQHLLYLLNCIPVIRFNGA